MITKFKIAEIVKTAGFKPVLESWWRNAVHEYNDGERTSYYDYSMRVETGLLEYDVEVRIEKIDNHVSVYISHSKPETFHIVHKLHQEFTKRGYVDVTITISNFVNIDEIKKKLTFSMLYDDDLKKIREIIEARLKERGELQCLF